MNHEDKKITLQFFFENEMAASIESLRTNKPSVINIETLEPSTLFILSKKNFEMLLKKVPEIKDFMMDVAFKRFAHYSKLYVSFLKNNPVERYKELLKTNPISFNEFRNIISHPTLELPPFHLAVSAIKLRNKLLNNC